MTTPAVTWQLMRSSFGHAVDPPFSSCMQSRSAPLGKPSRSLSKCPLSLMTMPTGPHEVLCCPERRLQVLGPEAETMEMDVTKGKSDSETPTTPPKQRVQWSADCLRYSTTRPCTGWTSGAQAAIREVTHSLRRPSTGSIDTLHGEPLVAGTSEFPDFDWVCQQLQLSSLAINVMWFLENGSCDLQSDMHTY